MALTLVSRLANKAEVSYYAKLSWVWVAVLFDIARGMRKAGLVTGEMDR